MEAASRRRTAHANTNLVRVENPVQRLVRALEAVAQLRLPRLELVRVLPERLPERPAHTRS